MLESIGKRIARLRQERGWTQQDLASRLAISRVAVSHIEMDLIIPSERTVTLLAGLFKMEPHDLVQDTTYPASKADRLPAGICCYTSFEMEIALLENDLKWLESLKTLSTNGSDLARTQLAIWEKWHPRLAHWEMECFETRERESLSKFRQALIDACHLKKSL
jgi:transcriptional regulator with XRE-family HTH domain